MKPAGEIANQASIKIGVKREASEDRAMSPRRHRPQLERRLKVIAAVAIKAGETA